MDDLHARLVTVFAFQALIGAFVTTGSRSLTYFVTSSSIVACWITLGFLIRVAGSDTAMSAVHPGFTLSSASTLRDLMEIL